METPAIIHRPNFTKIRAIIDGTNQMLRALPTLNCPVRGWDPFVNFIISTKLDEETRNEWKTRIGRRDKVKVTELLDFLEIRAIETQPTQGERLSQMLKGDFRRDRPRKIFQLMEKKDVLPLEKPKTECPLCKGPHRLWNC